MIKRSAILLLLLAVGSFSLLVFASYNVSPASPANTTPVKCSGRCNSKKVPVPVHWNIISPAIFQNEG